MQEENTDYKKLLTEVIKKQIVVLGPDITLTKARNVKGLTIENDGTVSQMSGNPQELIQELINQFVQLSGQIVEKTMEPLLANYHLKENRKISNSIETGPSNPGAGS
ncbi:MAG: hypothetical protein HYT08_04060 [Candidatus Levybacteria bacterium]|nr:hypothetical protein [Candidatus Levybacteria bacterium]